MTKFKSGVVAFVAAGLLAAAAGVAEAGTVNLGTFTGTNGDRAASATVTINDTTGVMTVALNNTTAAGKTKDPTFLLTGAMFKWSGSGVSVSYTSGAAISTTYGSTSYDYITVASNGTFTDTSSASGAAWSINNTSQITTIPTNSFLLSFSPNADKSIIGVPESDGDYSTANNGIKGNNGHNPFILKGATFTLGTSGWLTSRRTLTGVTFYFGTALEKATTTATPVPLPPAAWAGLGLLGGLGAVGLVRRRRRAEI